MTNRACLVGLHPTFKYKRFELETATVFASKLRDGSIASQFIGETVVTIEVHLGGMCTIVKHCDALGLKVAVAGKLHVRNSMLSHERKDMLGDIPPAIGVLVARLGGQHYQFVKCTGARLRIQNPPG